MFRRLAALCTGAVLLLGCAGEGSEVPAETPTAREAAVMTQVIAIVAAVDQPLDVAPVVFVAAARGSFGIDVQVAVAAALVDAADLRFADDPLDAFEELDDGWRVREDAMLLVIGAVSGDGDRVDVEVTRFFAAVEDPEVGEDLVVSVARREDGWKVVAVSVREPA